MYGSRCTHCTHSHIPNPKPILRKSSDLKPIIGNLVFGDCIQFNLEIRNSQIRIIIVFVNISRPKSAEFHIRLSLKQLLEYGIISFFIEFEVCILKWIAYSLWFFYYYYKCSKNRWKNLIHSFTGIYSHKKELHSLFQISACEFPIQYRNIEAKLMLCPIYLVSVKAIFGFCAQFLNHKWKMRSLKPDTVEHSILLLFNSSYKMWFLPETKDYQHKMTLP